MNTRAQVFFGGRSPVPRSPVPRVKQVKYLGVILNDSLNVGLEISQKLGEARTHVGQLKMLWKGNCPLAWKLHVYGQTVLTRLVYGLESVHITGAPMNRLIAAQTQHLRRIQQIPSPHVDHS